MNNHEPALLPIAGKTPASQPLSGVRPLVYLKAIIVPSLPIVKEGGFDSCHAGLVGIGFRRYIQPQAPGYINPFQKFRDKCAAAGIGMDDMQRSVGYCGTVDGLLHAVPGATNVDVRRRSVIRNNAQHGFKLNGGCSGRVGQPEANRDRPLPQTLFEHALHHFDLIQGCLLAAARAARHEPALVAHDLHA